MVPQPRKLADDALRRATLRAVEDSILTETGNRFERMVVLDSQANLLYTCDGDEGGVVLSAQHLASLAGHAYLLTHNHPHGLPFSVSDLEGVWRLRAREIDAFTPRSRFRLFLDAREQAWPWDSVAALRRAVSAIDSQVRQTVEPAVRAGAVTAAQATAIHRHGRWRLLEQRTRGAIHYLVEAR